MLTTVEKVFILKKVEIFKNIPGEVLSDIAFLMEEILFEEDEYIVTEGELGKDLYLIIDGSGDVVFNGRKIGEKHKGDIIGEMSIIDSAPRSASIIATSDVKLLIIGKDDFQQLLKQREEIALGLIKTLSNRIRELNQKIEKLSKESHDDEQI